MTTTIKIIRNERHTPQDKLADAELHFTGGELDGLKLIGFAVWNRRDGTGPHVRLPSRSFTARGQRRSFALLRSTDDPSALDRVRQLVLQAYAEHEGPANDAAW